MTKYVPSENEKLISSFSDDPSREQDTKEQIARPQSLSLQSITLFKVVTLVLLILGICWYTVRGKPLEYLFKCKGASSSNHIQIGTPDIESPIENNDKWLQSREYRRHETTASITGTFPLYDLLELTTQTGEIDITVVPKPGKGAAVIHLHTTTGRIKVNLDPEFLSSVNAVVVAAVKHDSKTSHYHHHHYYDDTTLKSILSRPFEVLIDSGTGSIQAEILIGNGRKSEITSGTGFMSLDVLPVGVGKKDNKPTTMLHTSTGSGSQDIRINDPPPYGSQKKNLITNLRTKHEVETGSVKTSFPELWRGKVIITALTGSIQATGKDLEIDLRENGSLEAHRGHGELVEMEALTGSVTFRNGGSKYDEKQ